MSSVGGAIGLVAALWGVGLLEATLPPNVLPVPDIGVDRTVVLFALGVTLLTGIVFGLFPALQLAKPEISQLMQASTRRLTGSAKGRSLHTSLIAGQIALTLLLMTAAGAAVQGFLRMHRVTGYDPQHVIHWAPDR